MKYAPTVAIVIAILCVWGWMAGKELADKGLRDQDQRYIDAAFRDRGRMTGICAHQEWFVPDVRIVMERQCRDRALEDGRK